ncbi:MAG: hypothetical protein A2365_00525 [Candidatus Nealsonbacteria bacterium RIFOXYB1_FULL_40_15]|uniref:Uncharacterized protein n=2 Tax=Candidatus Nealsoniibacteriota TaxID=1817911 RepID=A0A1G2ESG7_9BACT|nr:MAG: hypothetical protein A2365_00525 [Candidatus Nealsonbacteria bacterium RIFOXYB1_FULL_40_15]OGZ28755.1 MAG: hypothetical protein A2427_01705 [Candidatus Nealsonbacteria bacterium RIFOXYC1_FULL_40_7]OGZ29034.1 MAG: hypothetical protein A2562_00955 [Candidatus Nealsonbacteria bacterium RIFOXYD1_FULL_39_11]
MKLHLGCGEKYLEGYINIDFPPSEHTLVNPKADIFQDIRTLSYEENSVDEIRSHHLFEHFLRQESLKLLSDWRKWLKPGGVLFIETPDFEESAKLFVSASNIEKKFRLGRHMFGSHEADWAVHKDFWSRDKFNFILDKMGFENIEFNQMKSLYAKSFFSAALGKVLPGFLKPIAGDILPNIQVKAKKSSSFINERERIKEILSMSLVGTEKEMLDVWLKDI